MSKTEATHIYKMTEGHIYNPRKEFERVLAEYLDAVERLERRYKGVNSPR